MVLYADSPTTETTIEVEASIDEVWALITDPNFPASQSEELQEAHWVGGEEGCLGARLFGRNFHEAVGEWTTEALVVEFVLNSHWSWMIGDAPNQGSQWWFEIESVPSGAVRVTQRMTMGPGPSGLTGAIERMPDKEEKIVAGRMNYHQANMSANLVALKARLEG